MFNNIFYLFSNLLYWFDWNLVIFILDILEIVGPDFWGRLNPKWSHCSRGRRQSPIDINPNLLLYDPGLYPIQIHGDHVRFSYKLILHMIFTYDFCI